MTWSTGRTLASAVFARVWVAPFAATVCVGTNTAGAGDRVVGVLSPADWPPRASRLPSVGDARALDLERILALAPDLVVAWPYLPEAQLERLRELGFAIYISNPPSPEAIAEASENLGELAGSPDVASHAAAAFRARLAALHERARDGQKLAVFYEIWNQPLYTIGGGHLITAAIDRAAARTCSPG